MDKNHKETTQISQIDANRRRLTKAGLAVPAVLGALASRPVLAYVPWKCTISGQVSGNMSGHELETCIKLGDGQSVLANKYSANSETVTLNKRTLKYSANSETVTLNKRTLISELFDLPSDYFFLSGNDLTETTTDNVATIYEILSKPAPSSLLYAQRALVLLLNAKSIGDTTLYPVTEFQAKKLYVAAATQASYQDTNPTLTWSYGEVTYYIDLLWRA